MRRWLYLLALQLCIGAAWGATRVDLNNGWSILEQKQEMSPPLATGGMPDGARDIDLPHSWNRAGAKYDLLGKVWYWRKLDLPTLPADAIAQLHFGGVFYKAQVYLNGRLVGEHEGGYHEFSFDVTGRLHRNNTIAVLVDNQPGMYTIPGFGARGAPDAWYDWWDYGGITRGVWLDIHGPVRIASQFIRSEVKGTKAVVRNRVTIARRTTQRLRLLVEVHAPSGAAVAGHLQALAADATSAQLEIGIENAELWGLDNPRLYRMTVSVLDANEQALESATERFGLRKIEIRDRKLILNGQQVRLTGMTRHADSPWEGAAETRGTLAHDWADMKSLNMTLTRPVHYAPDPWVMEFADEHGILLIPEIPVWQASEEQLSNPQYLELAKSQMRELIEQYGNHPSVFAWSVMNESAAGTPGGIRFFRAMRDYIRTLDPERPVTMADDNLPKLRRADESAANDADFLMMNEYFGAWHGPREALGPALDKVNALFPTKMVIISEMGYPGIFAKNPADADPTRVSILREQYPELAKRDWIAGAILWCYQDYKSRRYFWPGQEGGYLEHGIVDQYRQRKPSYFAWAELNAPASLEAAWTNKVGGLLAAFSIRLTPKTAAQLPFLPLRDYQVTWQLLAAENKAIASGTHAITDESAQMFGGTVPMRDKPAPVKLVVKLLRPDGTLAMERSLAY
jgi:beta-glucuronidase